MTTILGLLSALAGFVAAYYWFKSAMLAPMPPWDQGRRADPLNEPIDRTLSQSGWIAGLLQTAADSGRLNKLGALWSGLATSLAALGTIANGMGY